MKPAVVIGSIGIGIIAGLVTIYILPADVEPFLWIMLAAIGAAMAQRNDRLAFRTGFVIAVIIGAAVTFTHILLLDDYMSNHAEEMREIEKIKIADSYALILLAMAPIYWVLFGLATGLLALAVKRIRKLRVTKYE